MLGEIWAKMVLELLWLERNAPNMKWKKSRFFLEVIFFGAFSGKFGEFGQKSFAPPKICLLLHLCAKLYFVVQKFGKSSVTTIITTEAFAQNFEFLQLRKLSRATRKALAGHMLCRPVLQHSPDSIINRSLVSLIQVIILMLEKLHGFYF